MKKEFRWHLRRNFQTYTASQSQSATEAQSTTKARFATDTQAATESQNTTNNAGYCLARICSCYLMPCSCLVIRNFILATQLLSVLKISSASRFFGSPLHCAAGVLCGSGRMLATLLAGFCQALLNLSLAYHQPPPQPKRLEIFSPNHVLVNDTSCMKYLRLADVALYTSPTTQ